MGQDIVFHLPPVKTGYEIQLEREEREKLKAKEQSDGEFYKRMATVALRNNPIQPPSFQEVDEACDYAQGERHILTHFDRLELFLTLNGWSEAANTVGDFDGDLPLFTMVDDGETLRITNYRQVGKSVWSKDTIL